MRINVSGKSEMLINQINRSKYAKKSSIAIKPSIDHRYSLNFIVCHNTLREKAMAIDINSNYFDILINTTEKFDVVAIDEIQFFSERIIDSIMHLVEKKKHVIVSGLDLNFRGEPFGIMPELLSLSDTVTKLRAVCVTCGEDANFSQRLIDGREAKYSDPTILVGGSECYEARCRNCFIIDKPYNDCD